MVAMQEQNPKSGEHENEGTNDRWRLDYALSRVGKGGGGPLVIWHPGGWAARSSHEPRRLDGGRVRGDSAGRKNGQRGRPPRRSGHAPLWAPAPRNEALRHRYQQEARR